MAWQEVGKKGSEWSSTVLSAYLAHTTSRHPIVSCCQWPSRGYQQNSLTFLPSSGTWPMRNLATLSHQSRRCCSNSLHLLCQLSGSVTFRQDMITSLRFSWSIWEVINSLFLQKVTYFAPGPPLKLSMVKVIKLVEPVLPLWKWESQLKNWLYVNLALENWVTVLNKTISSLKSLKYLERTG